MAQQPGITEIELFSGALAAAQNANGAPIEFLTDMLSGPLTSKVCCPIHVASHREVQDGDVVVADIALGAHGYFGDTAETHVVGSNAEATEQRARLLEILAQACTELVPGNTGAEIYDAMNRRILESFPGGEFPHHGGHGISVSAFEDPHLIPTDRHAVRKLDAAGSRAGCVLPREVRRTGREHLPGHPDGGLELRDVMGAR